MSIRNSADEVLKTPGWLASKAKATLPTRLNDEVEEEDVGPEFQEIADRTAASHNARDWEEEVLGEELAFADQEDDEANWESKCGEEVGPLLPDEVQPRPLGCRG
jgi:hypothetical protein